MTSPVTESLQGTTAPVLVFLAPSGRLPCASVEATSCAGRSARPRAEPAQNAHDSVPTARAADPATVQDHGDRGLKPLAASSAARIPGQERVGNGATLDSS